MMNKSGQGGIADTLTNVLIFSDIKTATFAKKHSNVTAYLPAPTGKLTVKEDVLQGVDNEITDTL